MPSSTEAARFQSLMAQLSAAAVQVVRALWGQSQDVGVLQEQYPLLVDPFMAGAASMAAEWYRSLAPDNGFPVDVPDLTPSDALQASVRWAQTTPSPVDAISGSTERRVFSSARDTVIHNAEREHVRYARHASANACAWCRVLATRDPVYHSTESATKGHDNCHCIAVPVREGDMWEPAPYVQQWMDDYSAARSEVGGNLNDIVNHMRRQETSPQGD